MSYTAHRRTATGWLVAGAFVGLVAGCSANGAADIDTASGLDPAVAVAALAPAAQQWMDRAVVLLRVPRLPDTESLAEYKLATAFFVDADTLVTCAHNLREVEATRPLYDVVSGGLIIRVELVEADHDADIAILRAIASVGRTGLAQAVLEPQAGVRGDRVFVCGFPHSTVFTSDRPLLTVGAFCGMIRVMAPGEDDERILIDAMATDGSSGSPVLDQHGRVIGMVQSVWVDGNGAWRGATVALPASRLVAAINRSRSR